MIRIITYITVLVFSTIIHSQTFRIERPVPDSIEVHGNYLYGEPWFWASGGAHRGLDMWVVYDTVYSAMDGYVEFAAYTPGEDGYEPDGFGNYLRTRSAWNGQTLYIYYAHLSKLLVDTGTDITVGKAIAISGNTGNSSGPHLHFEIRKNDSYYLAERTRSCNSSKQASTIW
ncbi:MAG: M23 family metallopeptidase [Chlorobi bacterium]|nr:M23 family metallopeptidase [Chlorobiota bacterium]